MKTVLFSIVLAASSQLFAVAQSSSWMNYDASNTPLPSNSITSLLHVENGIWVGTDQGLAFFNQSEWIVYTSESSALPDDYIRDIHQDNWGAIWVATDGGILKISHNGWSVYNTSNSELPSNAVRSVRTDADGELWVGTWGGGLAHLAHDHWTIYNTSNSAIPSDGIFTVEIDELGNPWVGTFSGGVSKLSGGTWTTFNTSNSDLPHNHVRTIDFSSNQDAWIGTDNGLAHISTSEIWDVYTYQNIGFSFHTIYDGIHDENGRVYFATDGGMLKFNGTEFVFLNAQNSNLTSNNIRSIDLDQNGNLWLGTGNDGISVYSEQDGLGVKEPLKGADVVTIYPNPTVGEISFLLPNREAGLSELIISDGQGKTLIKRFIDTRYDSQKTLDLSEFKPGTYFISILDESGPSYGKFLKL